MRRGEEGGKFLLNMVKINCNCKFGGISEFKTLSGNVSSTVLVEVNNANWKRMVSRHSMLKGCFFCTSVIKDLIKRLPENKISE